MGSAGDASELEYLLNSVSRDSDRRSLQPTWWMSDKMEELQLLNRTNTYTDNKQTSPDLLPCESPTPGWANTSLTAHYICRASSFSQQLSGKAKVGGLCFYINNSLIAHGYILRSYLWTFNTIIPEAFQSKLISSLFQASVSGSQTDRWDSYLKRPVC